jgi:AcrR family transcriptional regulator
MSLGDGRGGAAGSLEHPPAAETPGSQEGGTPGLTVSQLAERTGVGVPSIHHYRRLGLLPAPRPVAPNRFLYDERHVEALRVIRILRERRGLSLAAIGQVLPELLRGQGQGPAEQPGWDELLEEGQSEQDEVRRRLLGAARVAFGARGYDAVNVEELCQEAGIAKGSFYRYFPSKDAVFVAAVASVPEVVGQRLRAVSPGFGGAPDAVLRSALAPAVPLLLEAALRGGPDGSAGAAARHAVLGLAEVAGQLLGLPPPEAAGLVRDAIQAAVSDLLGLGAGGPAPGDGEPAS